MRIIDRYIIVSIIRIFLATILIFCFLYVLIDAATNLDEFLHSKVPAGIIAQYYLSFLPVIIVQTSSIACLISILFTFSTLNAHNEVIALRSSGMNFWQITKPALCFGLIVSAMVLLFNERFVPQAQSQSQKIKDDHIILEIDRKKKTQAKIQDLTFYGLKNRLYHIASFDPNTNEMKGITIIGYDNDQNVLEKIVALSGKWTGIASWKFFQCHVTTFGEDINNPTKVKIYEEKLFDIEEKPEDFIKQRLNVNSMNIKQLYDYIVRFSSSGAKTALNNLQVDLHQKIALPFGNIVIVLAGLPLALLSGRRRAQTFTSLGVAVGIGFLYFVCNAVGLALGKGGILFPFLAAWLAPLIFTTVGIYLIKTKF